MTNAAVQEKPDTQTTSEADTTQVSEEQSQLPENSVQQNSDQEQTSTEAEETTTPDPRQTRLQALADAEREEARETGRAEALAELQNNQQAQQREQQRQKVRGSFTTELQTLDNLAVEAVNNGLTLSQVIEKAKNSLNNYHKVASDVAEDNVATQVQEVAYNILPKEAQEAFSKLTADQTDLPTYLNHWVETAALHTKAVKSLSLEDAIKHSSKIKREVEAAKLQSYDEGREQGRIDPPGTSPDGGRTMTRSAPGTKSYIQLEEAYGNGTATKAEVAEYEKLRDARKKG